MGSAMNNGRQDKRNTKPQRKGGRVLRVLLTVFADILLIGIGLLVFAYFHHVRPIESDTQAVVLPTPIPVQTIAPSPEPTDQPAVDDITPAEPSPTPYVDQGMWGEKFADKFTDGDVIQTAGSYQSEDISVTVDKVEEDGVTYFVADIYVRNIENFKTAFAGGEYKRGAEDKTLDMAVENNAIVAISGDYCGIRADGIVIRNGVLYRDAVYEDVLIMNNDGSMQTFSPEAFDINAVLQNGAYQGWSFGPMLLKDGQPMDKFNSYVNPKNPRSAIGYYEPGHYCFVVVDGRQSGYSAGMTLKELSRLFYDLGCTAAYNLDGGQSAVMTFGDERASQPYGGGREISDIIYITEVKP